MKQLGAVAALAVSLAAPAAQALTPESGWWWSPGEAGHGLNLEVQDGVLALSVYTYTQTGEPVWYLAVGEMGSDGVFRGQLDLYEGGQCIRCDYREPERLQGFAGPVRIEFDSATRGTLFWEGGELAIQRHRFGHSGPLDRLLGEWQAVIDLSATRGGVARYTGDVLVLDRRAGDGSQALVGGYRPKAPDSGMDVAAAAVAGADNYVLLTDAGRDATGQGYWLAYYVHAGTDRFEGVAEVFAKGDQPSLTGYPVTGFRQRSHAELPAGGSPSPAKAELGLPEGVVPSLEEVAAGGTRSAAGAIDRAEAERLAQAVERMVAWLGAH